MTISLIKRLRILILLPVLPLAIQLVPAGTVTAQDATTTATTVPAGSILACGMVSFTAGGTTIGIGGSSFPISATATGTTSIVTGTNQCLTLTVTNGTVTTVTAATNPAVINYVCGAVSSAGVAAVSTTVTGTTTTTVGPISVVGSIMVGGFTFPVASGTLLPTNLLAGQTYCFLLAPTGTIILFLSSVPTAAYVVNTPERVYRQGPVLMQ